MDLINQQRAYLPTKNWGSTDLAKQTWGLSDRKQEYDFKKTGIWINRNWHLKNKNGEFNRFNHHKDFFHLTASEKYWSHLNISSYQMGQETPIFMLHSRLPIQIIQFLPRNRRVFPPFFLFRRGIGTAPVAVTISLRATPAAGNVVLPETPGQLSFNYGSSGDLGIPPLFNFI